MARNDEPKSEAGRAERDEVLGGDVPLSTS